MLHSYLREWINFALCECPKEKNKRRACSWYCSWWRRFGSICWVLSPCNMPLTWCRLEALVLTSMLHLDCNSVFSLVQSDSACHQNTNQVKAGIRYIKNINIDSHKASKRRILGLFGAVYSSLLLSCTYNICTIKINLSAPNNPTLHLQNANLCGSPFNWRSSFHISTSSS